MNSKLNPFSKTLISDAVNKVFTAPNGALKIANEAYYTTLLMFAHVGAALRKNNLKTGELKLFTKAAAHYRTLSINDPEGRSQHLADLFQFVRAVNGQIIWLGSVEYDRAQRRERNQNSGAYMNPPIESNDDTELAPADARDAEADGQTPWGFDPRLDGEPGADDVLDAAEEATAWVQSAMQTVLGDDDYLYFFPNGLALFWEKMPEHPNGGQEIFDVRHAIELQVIKNRVAMQVKAEKAQIARNRQLEALANL